MIKKPVVEDERTMAVENTAAKVTLDVVSWLLLIDLFLHGIIPDKINPNGFALDIFVIFLVSGITNLVYKWKHKTVTPRIIKLVIVTMVAAALISIVATVIIIKWLQ